MSDPIRPRRLQECSFRAIGSEGGLVVLPGRSEVKVLNPVAIRIFGLLDGAHTADQIVEIVLDEFDVTPEVAREDLRSFLGQLERHGMLASGESRTEEPVS